MQPFFNLLRNGAKEGQDLQVQVNQLRQGADEDVKRAEGFDVPDEMAEPQDNLLLVLNLRAEAIRKIADKIPTAQGRGTPARQANEQIAGQMQAFLASDVVYSQRVAPHIKEALDDAGIEGQTIATSRSLRDLAWLNPDVVAERLGSAATGGQTGEVAPGLHGHGLESVSVGNVTLQPGVTNRVPAAGGVTFNVAVANQGDNNESDVRVSVSVRGAGKPITVNKTIPQTTSKADDARVDPARAVAARRPGHDDRGLDREGPRRAEARQQPPELHGALHAVGVPSRPPAAVSCAAWTT
jgi:hypothetical protein